MSRRSSPPPPKRLSLGRESGRWTWAIVLILIWIAVRHYLSSSSSPVGVASALNIRLTEAYRPCTGDPATDPFCRSVDDTNDCPLLDDATCAHYTSLFAWIDVNDQDQESLSIVGTSVEPFRAVSLNLNETEREQALNDCPPGQVCTTTSNTRLSIESISFGSIELYWPLQYHSSSDTPDNEHQPPGFPFTYYLEGPLTPACSTTPTPVTSGGTLTAAFPVDNATAEPPTCEAQAVPIALADFSNDTCGNATTSGVFAEPIVPGNETGLDDLLRYLTYDHEDVSACRDVCCDDETRYQVHAIGPMCRPYEVVNAFDARIGLRFRVNVTRFDPTTGDTLDQSTVEFDQQVFVDVDDSVISDDRRVRMRIVSMPQSTLAQALGTLEIQLRDYLFIVCGDPDLGDPQSVPPMPDESQPVESVNLTRWFAIPSDLTSRYDLASDRTAPASDVTPHYGESLSSIEATMTTFYDVSSDPATLCADAQEARNYVPGYPYGDPNAFPPEPSVTSALAPSMCIMYKEAREGNTRFLPPGYDVDSPNWRLQSGGDGGSSTVETTYLVHSFSEEQLTYYSDAILLQIDVTDDLMQYEDTTADAVLVPGGYCTLVDEPTSTVDGRALLSERVESTVYSTIDDPGTQPTLTTVRIDYDCDDDRLTPVPASISGIEIPPGNITDPIEVNITVDAGTDTDEVINSCTIRLYDEALIDRSGGNESAGLINVKRVGCDFGQPPTDEDPDEPDCGTFDCTCNWDQGDVFNTPCVYFLIGSGVIVIVVLIIVIAVTTVKQKQAEQHRYDSVQHAAYREAQRSKQQIEQALRATQPRPPMAPPAPTPTPTPSTASATVSPPPPTASG